MSLNKVRSAAAQLLSCALFESDVLTPELLKRSFTLNETTTREPTNQDPFVLLLNM